MTSQDPENTPDPSRLHNIVVPEVSSRFSIQEPTAPYKFHRAGRDWVAIILAGGVSCSMLIFTSAILWDALFSGHPGLSENSTQVLVATFSGIIGALAVFLGTRRNPGDD